MVYGGGPGAVEVLLSGVVVAVWISSVEFDSWTFTTSSYLGGGSV